MPPLKSSAAFHEQRRSLERARTEDYLKRKIKSRPERSELIRMHILEETSAEPSLQAKQLQLKRARLADDLNDKISHRPGPMELIHKNILPVHSSIKQAIIETEFPKAAGENSSFDEDSNDSLSPEQPGSQESPLGPGPLHSPPDTLAGSGIPSPTQFLVQVPPPPPPLPSISEPSTPLKLTNETAAPSAQRAGASTQIKSQPKPNTDRSVQRPKKPKDSKPKIKKLKYHQYIPPDQKGEKEPPPQLDSSYAKILQQQQLFLQLQILSQQQQHYNYHTILPAPPKPQTDQQPCVSSVSTSSAAPSPPRTVTAPSTVPSNQGNQSRQASAPTGGTKPVSLPPNLDEMKVAELKSELKLRGLPVSGTKNDLIERLKTYQELNGGGAGGDGTASIPAAGGATGPGAEGAGGTSQTTASNNNTSQEQQQFQHHLPSSLAIQLDDAGGRATAAAAPPQQLMTFDGSSSSPPVSPTPSEHSASNMSPDDTSYNSDTFGEMMTSPLTQPSSAAQITAIIKEEPLCSTPAPCQFSINTSPLQKRCLVPAAVLTTSATTVTAVDKDKMLQEKDKQIEELTRMLRQKQRLVEALRMQLEHGKRGGRAQEGREGEQVKDPVVLVRVKKEPPDVPNSLLSSPAISSAHPPSTTPPSSLSSDIAVTKVTIKQEAIEAEEAVSETAMLSPHSQFLQSYSQTQETQEQIQLQMKPEKTSTQTQQQQHQQQHLRLQHAALQLAQQQAMQKLLLQQQQNIQNQQQRLQNQNQMLENQHNLQKRSQQRKKKSHKQQLKQQQQQLLLESQQQQSKQHQQQIQLKQQLLLKQQQSLLQQQVKQQQQQNPKQQQTKQQQQQIQIQTKIQLKQQQLFKEKQQLLLQQKLQAHQESQQVSQVFLNQQSASTPSLPLDILKTGSTPTLVTDSNGNHFLIALANHIAENQGTGTPDSKASNCITLQRLQSNPAKLPGQSPPQPANVDNQSKRRIQMGLLKQQNRKAQKAGLQVSTDQSQQGVTQSFSAPPNLQPFFQEQETTRTGKDALSPSYQTPQEEVCPGLDHNALFSPLSPASIKTATSSPGDKDTEHMDDIFDIIFQTGEISNFKPAPDPHLDHLNPSSPAPSPPPSPLQLVLSPPTQPNIDAPQAAPSVLGKPQTPASTTEARQQPSNTESGRLEDFLESTTGKPLLGVEPGGPLTLIDDLHSQMLSTPSILDHPSSPMDTYELGYTAADPPGGLGFGEQGLDSMDWLDLSMGEGASEETPALAPLGPQTPPSVFSTDFLDSSDLQIHWDSCL
ncbi:myocardin-related transcription factor A-like isoform X2 [Myripristis murdjan]|nr:myocardin-related transcription factor A-like isoform X2 [Myripristis murdjan]